MKRCVDSKQEGSKDRYGAIDGLRTIAALCIVIMHIGANGGYQITGYVFDTLIPAFNNFTFLFMTVSAFGMCCGYYERMLGKSADGTPQINMTSFYKKRFIRVLPFFALLCLLDFALSPSIESLYEVFANVTLLFGLLPNAGNITVIGVGWFLGLIFVFYLVFPFFCVLIENKKRAWVSFGVSLIYTFVCAGYFGIERRNILYCGCFFLAGGLIYLYRNEIRRIAREIKCSRWIMLGVVAVAVVFFYAVTTGPAGCLFLSVALLLYAVMSSKTPDMRGGYSRLLENRFTKFISGISMEVYLCHMVFFRVVEKFGFNSLIGSGWIQYVVTVVVVLVCAIVFSYVMRKIIDWCLTKLHI